MTLVHRRDEFRASKIMIDYARAKPNIEFVTNATVDEVHGEGHGKVTAGHAARHRHRRAPRDSRRTGCSWRSATTRPPGCSRGILDMDEAGYLITKDGSTETNVEGVFAAAMSSTTPTARP